jgi:hypothetical protein
MLRRSWTEGEIKRANDMRAAGYSYPTIDKALRRCDGATQQRLEIAGFGSGRHATSNRIPGDLLAERDALALPASCARLRRISVAIRRRATRPYMARQGCDDAAGAACRALTAGQNVRWWRSYS